ncbi:MAG TPA: hypothetical protein VL995_03020 [Cellvibrio sp.]|nr:hypothetical protein [Cellvibrio sp.]
MSITGSAKPNDEYTPAIITPLASGESLLTWSDATANKIHLMTLDNNDQSKSSLPDIDGLEMHSAIEISNGFALAVMENDPDIYSTKYCKSSATPDKAVCGKMDLVLLDSNGNLKKRTTLTEKGNVDSVGAQFIWWYGHTARLATNGPLIMAYFRSAMSTARDGVAGEVDIHAGDTLKFIDANTGDIQPGGWEWGCSHSWSVRAAHNGTTWGAACHGDAYPNAMQLVRRTTPASSSSTIQWLTTEDPAKRALGGLVPANNGFWLNYIQNENSKLTLKLGQFNDSLSQLQQSFTISVATNLDSTYPFRVYMAAYGNNQLLLGWKSAGKLVIAVADATTGDLVEGPVTTTLNIDNFQEIFSAGNGDVVWAHTFGGNKISVNRISSCHE